MKPGPVLSKVRNNSLGRPMYLSGIPAASTKILGARSWIRYKQIERKNQVACILIAHHYLQSKSNLFPFPPFFSFIIVSSLLLNPLPQIMHKFHLKKNETEPSF